MLLFPSTDAIPPDLFCRLSADLYNPLVMVLRKCTSPFVCVVPMCVYFHRYTVLHCIVDACRLDSVSSALAARLADLAITTCPSLLTDKNGNYRTAVDLCARCVWYIPRGINRSVKHTLRVIVSISPIFHSFICMCTWT